MPKIILCIVVVLSFVGCTGHHKTKQEEHTLLKEIVINHSKEDSALSPYGYYKEVYRIYNYQYKDSFMYGYAIDSIHQVDVFYNEYGDTVCKKYIDVSNYPRREE